LGNGKQRKSYLHVEDCVRAILVTLDGFDRKFDVYNLGTPEYCEVNDSIGWIAAELDINPEREYSGGERGWIGDNPFIFLDTKKIESTGWKARYSIEESIRETLRWLRANAWVLDSRA
jgi:UDP-glucose 4-epimerase